MNLKEINNKIDKIYFEKSLRAEDRKKQRIEELSSKSPEFSDLHQKIIKAGLLLSKASLFDNKEDIKKYTNILDNLILKRDQIVESLTNNKNYLNDIYDCYECRDTGYIQIENQLKMCQCRNQLFIEFLYEQSNIKEIIKEHNFQKFKLSYYSKEINEDEDISPYENVRHILKNIKQFIDNFDKREQRNLLIYGNTGLGKTFLAHSIAKEMLDRRKTVLFLDSLTLFEILKARYDSITSFYNENKEDSFRILDDIDLLIIDDLGTEGKNMRFLHGVFQSLLDNRYINNKKMVITTNLNITSLNEYYQDKNVGRLQEYFLFLYIFGNDIRVLKTKKEYS
ncbi:ATP-binding protein [Caldicellulosiruptoraceae bacterium PP1]